MFKLVVLCAFIAAGAAEPEPEPKPGSLIATPFLSTYSTYPYSTYLAPATTTITKEASSIVHPSPYYGSSPLIFPHFIKKRSASLPFTYFPSTYSYASAPYATTYTAPFYNTAPILPAAPAVPYVAAAHLIKKRSAPLLPTTYIAPTTYAAQTPLLASTYSTPFISSPLIPQPLISQPLVSTHFIKKRSAPILPLVNSYVAPASFSHQSRIDLHAAAPYAAFPAYSQPIAYTHVL